MNLKPGDLIRRKRDKRMFIILVTENDHIPHHSYVTVWDIEKKRKDGFSCELTSDWCEKVE